MSQNWIVALVVLVAAIYSVWYALPITMRQRLGRIHHRLGPSKPCASCSSCGGCAAGKPSSTGSMAPVAAQTIAFYPLKKS
jgi:disulfide bond formation protein DsbB